MASNETVRLVEASERIAVALEKIAQLLEQSLPCPAPNYKAILEEFPRFDWEAIGAQVEMKDNYGVATVIWNGERYKRRSPSNAYGAVIFFSRCSGKDEDGKNKYERLITFEPFETLKAEPISRSAEELIK